MKIGYLHLGLPDHGVRRYGQILASEARRQPHVSTREIELALKDNAYENVSALVAAGRQLSDVDLVHLQYNCQRTKSIWGRGWRQISHLWIFALACRRPLIVTVHDIYPRKPLSILIKDAARRWNPLHGRRDRVVAEGGGGKPIEAFTNELKKTLSANAVTLRWLNRRAARLLVCSQMEKCRLTEFVGDSRVRVVPHFVEERVLSLNTDEAKLALGLSGAQVITMLGFIHARKGHTLLVEALPELPTGVVAVFAGGARDGNIVRDLTELARARGVLDRIRITGYLDEDSLNRYLAATDLAVCPFHEASASSSLSTWISSGKPILASDLPLMAEYNRFEPGAIQIFTPYTAGALANAIRESLAKPIETAAAPNVSLRRRLATPSILLEHISVYREALQQARNRNS